jgi:catechol 2,3-dioxygenase-like lactoylglutathione lyase family enzyme
MPTPGPLSQANLFHTGIVVDDLDAAKAELGERLGVTWNEGGAEVLLVGPGGTQKSPSAYVISREGPHHVELCQAVPGTVWTGTAPGQAHHLGYWVDDVATASAELTAGGAPAVACVTVAEDVPPMCAYHRTANGLLVEVVSRGMRRFLLPDT